MDHWTCKYHKWNLDCRNVTPGSTGRGVGGGGVYRGTHPGTARGTC